MPLMPKRVKHRKVQRGNNAGLSQRCNQLDFGDFGLQTMERSQLTANQIEAARVAITRHMKRRGKVWIRVFPYKPYTKKPLEVRMGKGKGSDQAGQNALRDQRLFRSGCQGSDEPCSCQTADQVQIHYPSRHRGVMK